MTTNPADADQRPAADDTLESGPDAGSTRRWRLALVLGAVGTLAFVVAAVATYAPVSIFNARHSEPTASATAVDPVATTAPTSTPTPAATATFAPSVIELPHGARNLAAPITLRPIRDVRPITATTFGPHNPSGCPGRLGTTRDYNNSECFRLDRPVLTIRRLRDLQAVPVAAPTDAPGPEGTNSNGSVPAVPAYGDPTLVLTLTKADAAALTAYTNGGGRRPALAAVVVNDVVYAAVRIHPRNASGRITLIFSAEPVSPFLTSITK
jgi:hypothetical protein